MRCWHDHCVRKHCTQTKKDRTMRKMMLPLLVVLGLSIWSVSAQSDPGTPPDSGNPPDVTDPVDPPETPPNPEPPVKPEKPEVPARPVGVTELRDLIQEFKSAREGFLQQRLELVKQLRSATAEERATIRESIQQNLAEWRTAQREHVQELREAAKDIKNTVGSVSDAIDSARQEGRGK